MSLELILFTGLQGSGKSTFYRARFADTHVLVSKDLFPNARNRDRRQQRLIEEAFAAGRSVVVDNTNPAPEQRLPLVALGRVHGARVVCYAFESNPKDCYARNAAREGKARIPDVGFYATLRKLTIPSLDEGYDALYRVRVVATGFDAEELLR